MKSPQQRFFQHRLRAIAAIILLAMPALSPADVSPAEMSLAGSLAERSLADTHALEIDEESLAGSMKSLADTHALEIDDRSLSDTRSLEIDEMSPADTHLLEINEVSRGTLLVKTPQAGQYQLAPAQETSVTIEVTGPIARATVTQHFKNPCDAWIEAIYAFPLPEQAAVDHMRLQVGERSVEGQIKEKMQARKIHIQAKQKGQHSALIEQHRPNLFTTSVANIPPHGEVSVEIEYQQRLQWHDHRFSLRFPMAITPRYQPRFSAQVNENLTVPGGWSILPGEIPNVVPMPQTTEGANLNPVRLQIKLNPGFPVAAIESPYHSIRTVRSDNNTATITLAASPVPADRDFVLQWSAKPEKEPRAAFFTEQTEAGRYGLLMMMPPQSPDTPRIPRETIFIIDTSGSMGGASIRQAKAALIAAIESLHPSNRFNIIEFNSRTNVLYPRPQPASTANRQFAVDYVSRLNAGGGTEMMPALQAAFSMPAGNDGFLRQILFITDGAVGNEEPLLRLIHQNLGQRRLFTVAIGSAPNGYFMREAAQFGRGSFTNIGNLSEVSRKMQALFGKLEKPALTDLHIKLPGQADVLPDPLPDLYQGEPVIAAMKFDTGVQPAEITGRMGDTQWNSSLSLRSPTSTSGLGVYWAREKIRHWMRKKASGQNAGQIRKEVIGLALAHHLVSRYTSLVAVDTTPARPPEEAARSTALPANLPAGWKPATAHSGSDTGVQVSMAQSATSSRADLLFGALLILLAILIRAIGTPVPTMRCGS